MASREARELKLSRRCSKILPPQCALTFKWETEFTMPSIGDATVARRWLSRPKMGTDPPKDGQLSAYKGWSIGLVTHTGLFNRHDIGIGGFHYTWRDMPTLVEKRTFGPAV